jgi:hypothetical protein
VVVEETWLPAASVIRNVKVAASPPLSVKLTEPLTEKAAALVTGTDVGE